MRLVCPISWTVPEGISDVCFSQRWNLLPESELQGQGVEVSQGTAVL